jgi:hypothetical protein
VPAVVEALGGVPAYARQVSGTQPISWRRPPWSIRSRRDTRPRARSPGVRRRAGVFTGDSVLGAGSVFIAPDPGALSGYLAALEGLRARDLERLYPGHG